MYQVFELSRCSREAGKADYYIPYLMNDALECCLVLKECTLAGDYILEEQGETKEELVREGTAWGLIVRQGNDNTFALWFKEMDQVLKCFCYHQIGHFWVQGQEQRQQLRKM